MAVVNDGPTTVRVTCAFPGFQGAEFGGLTIWFTNFGARTAEIDCTFITGTAATGVPHAVRPVYERRVRSLAGRASDALFLTGYDMQTTMAPTSISCTLPPRMGIGDLYFGQFIDH